MGGRGGSSGISAGEIPTRARDISKMNNAQLDLEISKAEKKIDSLQKQRDALSAGTAEERALREAFPLGAAGLNRTDANKLSGRLSEQALNRGKKLDSVIKEQESQKKRLSALKSEKSSRNKSTSQTKTESTMTWKTTQKQSYKNGVLQPRIIKSGDFEIRGTSVLRIYQNGKQVGTASTLNAAKELAERLKKKRR